MAKELKVLIDVLEEVAGATKKPVSLHEPEFGGNDWNYVKNCIDTGWVSSVGSYVDRFERELAELFQVKRAVAVANGTAALHVSLLLAGVRRDEEVLVPALSFIATANAVVHAGAVPHFVDSEAVSLGVDAKKLHDYFYSIAVREGARWRNKYTGRRIAALVVMHCFGHPADLDALVAFSTDTGLPLIEDAAESIGSLYKGRPTATKGLISCVSFNGNKIVTTGGGGAVLTNDEELGRRAKHLTTTAKRPHRWEFFHDETGFNYRLPNLNAALGCSQLEKLPDFLARKRKLSSRYREAFAENSFFHFLDQPAYAESNFWLNTVVLKRRDRVLRDTLLDGTNAAGFSTRPLWCLMHRLPMYANCPRSDLSVAEDLEDRVINLPSSPILVDSGRMSG